MDETPCGTIVVFDYNWSGHIPAYHRLIVESALRAGWKVVSLSGGYREVLAHVNQYFPEALGRLIAPSCPELGHPPERKTKLAFLRWLPGGFALWSIIRRNPFLRARHAAMRWQACHAALARMRHTHFSKDPDLLFLPYLDDMLEPLLRVDSLMVNIPWTGIYMSASDLRSPSQRAGIHARLHLFSHPLCRGVAVLDDSIRSKLLTALPSGSIITFLPDVIGRESNQIESENIRELLRRARGRKIVGLLGHLSVAKNLKLLLDLASDSRNQDIFFLFAGQYEPLGIPPATRNQLAQAAAGKWDNMWALLDRIPDDREFNAFISRLDVVFAVYRDFCRSSNILSKAALFRRPVIVAQGFCMAERTAEYSLGLAVPENNPAATITAIRRLLTAPPAGDYERFARDFSREEFENRLSMALRQSLSLLSPPYV